MREIKFRAWVDGKMFDEGFHISSVGHPWYWLDEKYTDSKILDGVIMQYTGLKDKNGKEIWEGDLVACFETEITGGLKHSIKNTVSFFEGAFGYWLTSVKDFVSFECNTNFKWQDEQSEFIEVIGNIYELPDLKT